MKTFLRRIDSETNPLELQEFLVRAFCPRWYRPFRPNGMLTKCNILQIRDSTGVEHHGLAEIRPESVAQRAMIVLNGKQVGGRMVEVREWHERSDAHDRRRPASGRLPDLSFPDRRRGDRRRKNLTIEMI